MSKTLYQLKWCLVFAALVCLDQLTKILAADHLKDAPLVLIPGVFRLQYLENRGAAFGILQDQRWFFIVLTLAFLLLILWVWVRIPQNKHYLALRVLCVLIAAGAAGNLIDRMFLVYVRDFLYFSLINFPIFNVADIYVTCSAALMFLLIFFYYGDEDFSFLKPASRKDGAHE